MEHIHAYGELPARLAAAVGLDPDHTEAFTIEVFPDDLIRVRSNQVTTGKAIEEVATIFETAASEAKTPVVNRRPFIPVARLEDIRIRAAAGTLTSAERLALAVLAGGKDGEEGVPALIDAAQEEYSHGTYRVPVRIVGDKKRLKILVIPPPGSHLAGTHTARLFADLEAWISGQQTFCVVPCGFSIRAFEMQGDGSQVEVSLGTTEGE